MPRGEIPGPQANSLRNRQRSVCGDRLHPSHGPEDVRESSLHALLCLARSLPRSSQPRFHFPGRAPSHRGILGQAWQLAPFRASCEAASFRGSTAVQSSSLTTRSLDGTEEGRQPPGTGPRCGGLERCTVVRSSARSHANPPHPPAGVKSRAPGPLPAEVGCRAFSSAIPISSNLESRVPIKEMRMQPSKNLKLASALSAFTMLSLFALSLGPAGAGRAVPAADVQGMVNPGATQQPQCRLDFQVPEGLAVQDARGGSCSAAPAGVPLAAAMQAPRHGYCRCSCGYPCRTSADCGGVSCDPFITCC